MAEHYTQGRQGQGARRRHNHQHHYNHRHRMPRPESAPAAKPSLLKRVLNFLGIGKKKKDEPQDRRPRNEKAAPRQNVRVAKGRANQAMGNPAARPRRRAASTPPTRNARLYVGNLSYEATEAEIEDLFKGFGHVRSVEVIYNSRTYKSKGYAFVEMGRLEDARKATEVLHGQPFMGRELMVSAACERAEREQESPTESQEAETPAGGSVTPGEPSAPEEKLV